MGDSSSDLLFARTSFLDGVARILDLGGTLIEFNRSLTSQQADALALRMDVEAVAADLRRATSRVIAEVEQSQLSLPLG